MTDLLTRSITFEQGDDLRRLASCRRDRARFVEIPEKVYLAVDGTVEPGSEPFVTAIQALYGTAYRLHFALRGRGLRGHRVGLLEGLYWLTPEELVRDEPSDGEPSGPWRWRLFIAVPDEATIDEVTMAIRAGGLETQDIVVERWAEGRCAQILHVGPYEAEAPTLRRLFAAIHEAGMRPVGAHHEIYLNDPMAVGPERTKTVLRHPVAA